MSEDVGADRIGIRSATAVLVIEGFVSVSIQMIVLRQLVPIVGYSINVTSIVITTFLAALALGYRAGGRLRSGHIGRIRRSLLIASLLTAIGLSTVAVDAFFRLYLSAFDSVLVGVAFYSAFIVVPIVFCLAQTVVLLINFQSKSDAAKQAGDTFHLSTIGNVVGGLVTTLVIMYYFGVAASITLDVALLLLAYAMISTRRTFGLAVGLLTVLVAAIFVNLVVENALFTRTTAYADYYVVDDIDGNRVFVVNGQSASRTDHNGVGHPYIEWFEDQLFGSPTTPQDVLVLGAGGFTLGQGREYSGALTFVDVDSRLAELADEFLSPRTRSGNFIPEDARAFLIQSDRDFDAIVIDTYSHRSSMPPHLMTQEFFALVRSRLHRDGIAYMNIIGSNDERHRFTRGIDNTIRAVFGDCQTHRIETPGTTLYNKLYRCKRSELDSHRVVYTDRNTRAAVDSAM